MKLTELPIPILSEGGHVFKKPSGEPITQKIARSDIVPTLRILEPALGIPLVDNVLGSAGKKAQSGDIDISVDPDQITKDELMRKLKQWVQHVHGKDGASWVKKSGISVHFLMPIRNDPKKGYVQIDFMFHRGGPEETDWMKFSMYSAGDTSEYSGADRNMLMSAIAKAHDEGMKYSWQKGLIRRQDEQLISRDPDQIAVHLLGAGHDHTSLLSVETIQAALDAQPELKRKLHKLSQDLLSDHTPSGEPIKPGERRINQAQSELIQRLVL